MRARTRRLGFICDFVVLLAAALLGGQATVDHLAAGERALQEGRLAQARAELQAAVREQPRNAEATLQLGLLLGLTGQPKAAAAAFEKCLQIDPTSAEAHYNLGLTKIADRYGTVDWQGAITEFRRAIRLRPNYAKAHHSLGAALAETGARETAIDEFRTATRFDPKSAEDHLDLANALREAGQRQEALSEYRAALELRPDYQDAEVGWGMLLAEEAGNVGALDEAIVHFRRALQSNPDDLKAQYRLGVALKRQGHAREADVAFREAQALTNRQQESVRCIRLSNEALDAAHHDDRSAALRLLREAVTLKSDSAIAHYNLGLVLADTGQLPDAAGSACGRCSCGQET